MKAKYIFVVFIIHISIYSSTPGFAQVENNTHFPSLVIPDSSITSLLTFEPSAIRMNKMNSIITGDGYKNELPTFNNVHYQRLACASMLLISLNYAAYQPFKDAWWEEDRTEFHLYRGWRRNKGYWDFGWHDTLYGHLDKLGHYYSARLLSQQIYHISRWIGFDENSSEIIGPILSSLLMLEIEIYDGFFKEWGFSLADFTFNELGAFSPILGKKIPALNYFQLKLSYHPSNLPQQQATFIKDYAGMTYWLSFNVHAVLPVKLKKYYPPWLNLSLGYGVSKPARGQVEFYLAPDINWQKVSIGNSPTLNFIKKILNYFHFPSFALKLTPDKRFYPIYF